MTCTRHESGNSTLRRVVLQTAENPEVEYHITEVGGQLQIMVVAHGSSQLQIKPMGTNVLLIKGGI